MGWVLLQNASLPWVRFHSLPGSKRYAETEEETALILSRGNQLASEFLGEGQTCWIVTARPNGHGVSGDEVGSWIEDEADEDSLVWRYFAEIGVWSSGIFDEQLKDLADDALEYVIWFRPSDGRVFAPYDGGFDLFSPHATDIAEVRDRHTEWLSAHPDGL